MVSYSASFQMTKLAGVLIIATVIGRLANLEGADATTFCPKGQSQYGTRCYKTYRPAIKCSQDFSFYDANAFCQANGGQLASVHNQSQHDHLTALIKHDQRVNKPKCGCKLDEHDYNYWIGLRLTHSASGSVNGSSWTDGTPVNYGNPLSADFRPPFADGRPAGSADDGGDDSAVCPLGNTSDCVQIFGYGNALGLWTDRHCNNTHTIEHSCDCKEEHGNNNNSSSSSSSSSEENQIDECRDENALNGFICQYCPGGWTMFQGHCYKAVPTAQTPAQFQAICENMGAEVVSIHNAPENVFVNNLAVSANPGAVTNYIGLAITHTTILIYSPVNSAAWSDGTPVNYGNPMVAPWNTPGVYPWAPASPPPGFQAQPDNLPQPGNCVFQWMPASPNMGNHPGTWDDALCGSVYSSSVCMIN